MNKVKQWYVINQDAITWFIIGWVSLSCINSLAKGSYGWAIFDAIIVYVNYKLSGIRLT